MPPKKEKVEPELTCIRCGQTITADDYDEAYRLYTKHVVRQHDKPSMGSVG